MRTTTILGCALLLLAASLASAGAETLVRDVIAAVNDMATTVEKAKTAAEAKPKLEELVTKFAELQKNYEQAKRSPEENAKLNKEYDPQLQKALTRFSTAVAGLTMRDPEGAATLKGLFSKTAVAPKK